MLLKRKASGKNLVSAEACRVQGAVGTTRTALGGLVFAALGLIACGRTPDLSPAPAAPLLPVIDAATPEPIVDARVELAEEVAPDVAPDAPLDLPPDLGPDLPRETKPEAPAERPPVEAGPVCYPQPETCNGIDDDCDGKVDQGLPAIPCPNGGERYCVAGKYSECPRRCEVCVPGSERECFTSFCTFWGTQACASDGRSFGACREAMPPAGCKGVADKQMKSPELEQCCLDQGLCCRDDFDLDHDGDTNEMLGRCDTVLCGP